MFGSEDYAKRRSCEMPAARRMTLREEVSMTGAERREPAAEPSAALAGGRRRGVLFVIGSLSLGGTESQLVLLAKELARRGWRVEVFALTRAANVLADPLSRAGVTVFYGRHRPNAASTISKTKPGLKEMLALVAAVMWLFRRVALERPSVIHAFLPLANFMSALAGQAAFARLVITSRRGAGTHQERWPWLKWMDRFANRFSHVVVANSHAVAADTAMRDGYDINKIEVIPNGLDLSRFDDIGRSRDETRHRLGLDPSEIGIVIVANLIPYKGHKDLIEAFARASEKRPNLRLFMAGEDRGIGPRLAEEAQRFGVSSKVHALGTQSDVPGLLAGMDVGVIASHEEGFCNALIEKLAAGLPVVATNVGGNPEALSGMSGCVLVKAHDPADLARGLLAVIEQLPEPAADREFRRRVMRERYSTRAMVDAYERIYLTG
ncbi:MAG: glycosyltransferase [Mesorhizobium sp.]|nr:MAG: glycosyltransferase [Mesorhizobium sp.]RWE51155.1 MAG: glycosyltransferase [Mesorhizobium sp.]